MTSFKAEATSAEVVSTFADQVKGRVFVITGASQPGNKTIGASIVLELARASPAQIVLASRTASKVDPVLSSIREIDPSVKATFVQLDLSDHDSVRKAASEIEAATGGKIDVLINSAGNMALKEYMVDKQGIEMQMSANHVGHFLLTNLLMPALLNAASGSPHGARVVNLSSAGYQISPVNFDDPNFAYGKEYDMWIAYGQAKVAQILFAYGLTDRLKSKGVTAFACHPGSNFDTNLGNHLNPEQDYNSIIPLTKKITGNDFSFTHGDEPRVKSYEQIAATPLIAALDPELRAQAPAFLQNNQVAQLVARHAYDPDHVEKCWKLSEKLVEQEFKY